MTRIAWDWIVDGTPLDELFDEVAEDQYTRELTLTHFVQVMLDVASGHRPSPRAAFLRRDLPLVASLSAFYRKLNRMELAVPEAVVRRTALRARRLIVAGGGLMPEPIEGDAARILDGNVLTGTEHRIASLRTTGSAGSVASPANSGSWTATSACARLCSGSRAGRRSSWSAGIARRCRFGPPADFGRAGAAPPVKSSSSRSMSTMVRGAFTACAGSC